MKKFLFLLLAVCLLAPAGLFANGTENNYNMDAGFLRNPSKNTETKSLNAIFYNPAGTAFMADGLYLGAGNQFVLKEYSHEIGGTTYKADTTTFLYPNAELLYKKDNFAFFGAFGVFAGGGTLEYKDGSATLQPIITGYLGLVGGSGTPAADRAHSLEVFSVTYGETFGASVAVNDYLSFAVGVRFLQASQSLELTFDHTSTHIPATNGLTAEASATGIGGIFGVYAKPIDKFDVALQYQTKTKLLYEWDKVETSFPGPAATAMLGVARAAGYAEGNEFQQDLPALLGLGAGYQVFRELYTSVSFNYYFNKMASDNGAGYSNSWEIAAGAEYTLTKEVLLSLGAFYTKQGTSDTANSYYSPKLDSFTIGTGTQLTFVENMAIDIGIFKPIYFSTDYGAATLKKENQWLFAISAAYKFF